MYSPLTQKQARVATIGRAQIVTRKIAIVPTLFISSTYKAMQNLVANLMTTPALSFGWLTHDTGDHDEHSEIK